MEVIDTLHTTAVVWRKTWHVSDSIVAVHPTRNPDATGLDGTISLRKSKSFYRPERTFSVVFVGPAVSHQEHCGRLASATAYVQHLSLIHISEPTRPY